MNAKSKNNTKDFAWNAIGLTLNACNSLFFLIVVRFVNGLDTAGIFTYTFALCVFLYAFLLYYNRSFQVSDAKDKFSFEDADRIMMESMGKHFDKRLERYYLSAKPVLEEYYRSMGDK